MMGVRRQTLAAAAIVFGIVFPLVSTTPTVVGYGESCDAERKCNKRAFLTCSSEGICACSRPDKMVYEADGAEMCVMKVGEPCKYAVDVDPEGKQLFHVHTCVQNSECDPAGYCNCSKGYFENSNSTCTLGSLLGESCDEKLKCSATGGFTCEENVCVCDKSIAMEDSSGSYCVGLAGKSCIEGNCVGNADCVGKSCKCSDGFYQDESGSCQKKGKVGDSCSRNEECEDDKVSKVGLVCENGKCSCDPKNYVFAKGKRTYNRQVFGYDSYSHSYGHHQYRVVSEENQLCAPKANLDCTQGYCAPLSKCSFHDTFPEDSGFRGTCTCEVGFEVSNSTGLCARKHGMSCDTDEPCAFPLVCKNNHCSCVLDLQEFDIINKRCQSGANGPCKGDQDCKSKASCTVIPGSDSGHCACNNGYAPQRNGECAVTVEYTARQGPEFIAFLGNKLFTC